MMTEDAAATAKDTSSSTPKAASNVTSQQKEPANLNNTSNNELSADDEEMLLVSEFPPPPSYYPLASQTTPAHLRLTPPEIPLRSFRIAAKKVMGERRRAMEESERIRLAACQSATAEPTVNEDVDDDSIDPNDPNVVAVFGEIAEDPTLVMEQMCDDPTVIRENVKALNQEVLNRFLKLVRVLVNDPNENKKLRDELSHNLFLMLQECNKFREHQSREILITTLEEQLRQREEGLELLKKEIGVAEDALDALYRREKMKN